MLSYGTVTCRLDLDAPGKRAGWIELSHSDNVNEFSAIRGPIGVIRGGAGPVALVTGGNHGDEYEGQIIARRLFEMLEPGDVPGGLIMVPALNTPAVLDAHRISPLDQGNMNRSFPGAEGQGPTKALAGFATTHLMPRAGLVIDLHSGGSNGNFIDAAYFCLSDDVALNRRTRGLVDAFALPWTVVVPPGHTGGDLDAAAQAAGCAMISCELGGEGRVSRRALDAGWQGVLRVLAAEGVITAEAAARLGAGVAGPTRFADLGAGSSFATAMRHGIAEPLVRIGDKVAASDPVAIVRDVHDLTAAPETVRAETAGIVLIRRRTALVRPGDHLYAIGAEMTPEEVARAVG